MYVTMANPNNFQNVTSPPLDSLTLCNFGNVPKPL